MNYVGVDTLHRHLTIWTQCELSCLCVTNTSGFACFSRRPRYMNFVHCRFRKIDLFKSNVFYSFSSSLHQSRDPSPKVRGDIHHLRIAILRDGSLERKRKLEDVDMVNRAYIITDWVQTVYETVPVTRLSGTASYIGMIGATFKTRFANHAKSFK